MSLRWKINLMFIFIVLLFSLIVYFLILPFMEKEKAEERQGKLQAVVNSAVSLIDYHERAQRKEAWKTDASIPKTIEEAKVLVAKHLREIRYDKTEYLFILDGNGTMIMHPMKPELEGKNMLDVKDPKGVLLFRDMVMNSQRDGETFVRYIWQSKYSPVINEPQITYAKYYWPWNWVICSSLYTQDISDAMKAIVIRSAIYDIGVAALAMVFTFIFVYIFISKPLNRLLQGIREIHNNNLDYRIDVESLDEIGYVSQEFNYTVSALKESRDRIIHSESKYRELADLLPDVIYETDMGLNITYLNKAGHALTGYTEEDIAQGLTIKRLIDDDTADLISGSLTGDNHHKFLLTHKIYKRDGRHFFGENNGTIIFEGKTRIGLRGSIRDVTDKLMMEEQLIQTQKMETIGTLAGGLAHDFNNVLAGITSTLSIIKYEIENQVTLNKQRLQKHLDIMDISGQRAADMVQQLLTLSRKRDTQFAPFDLKPIIGDVIKLCKNTFDKCIAIQVELPEENAIVHGDQTQIEQVVLNICINSNHAMTFMKKEGIKHGGNLVVSLEKIHVDEHFCMTHPEAVKRDYWKISVRDTGVGMDSTTVSKVFVPFFTTKEKGKGTGLGLSMVYQIVQQHKGFIDIYSEVEIGTTFNVYLPVLYTHDLPEDMKVVRELPKGHGLILVVDDEEILRHTARLILEKCGYEVITADNGEEGVRIYKEKQHEIRAVLMDLVMPKKSGEQAYLELKEINKDVKVLLTSGFKQDERVNMALSYGISGFIQKPFSLEALAQAMYDILEGCSGKA